ncbi:ribonuclease H-like domain-containing protein [Hypoxylon argillaceum]|nr:ribonuclease H-like domain-containing protein [Hypoxylon argillaceum]
MSLAWYHLHGRDYSFADDALCNSEGENRDKDEENSRDETIESLRQRVLALEIELDRYKHRSNLPRESTHAAQRSSNQISSSASAPPPFNFIGACWPSQELPSSSTTNSHDTRGGRDLDSRDHLFGLVRRARKGTGRVFPGRFPVSSGLTQPFEIFRGKVIKPSFARYVHRSDSRQALIFTDGACLNNGQPNPRAGWAFVYGFSMKGEPGMLSGRLENEGPFGDHAIQTSNRAELRAVIAALRSRYWDHDGFKIIVIATDSEYVTQGSTVWAKTWVKNGWRRNDDTAVKNKDLWEMLLGEAEILQTKGVSIQFWRIPREWNTVADAAAKKAAKEPAIELYMDAF